MAEFEWTYTGRKEDNTRSHDIKLDEHGLRVTPTAEVSLKAFYLTDLSFVPVCQVCRDELNFVEVLTFTSWKDTRSADTLREYPNAWHVESVWECHNSCCKLVLRHAPDSLEIMVNIANFDFGNLGL